MRSLPYRFLLLSLVPFAAFAVAVGCGGRTGSDDDFSGETVGDSSIGDTSFDATTDGIVVDTGPDGLHRDVLLDTFGIDTRPDGISVDVIGVDVGPDVIRVDSGSDVISVDTTPDVIEIDTTPDVIEIDSGFDIGVDTAPVDGGIHCGTGPACDPATQECCAMFGGSFSCVATGTCGGFPLSCSDSTTCPTGDVCCLELGGPGGGGSASCVPGFCPGIQLCATTAECPPGTRCRRLFGGYRSCR